MLDKEQRLKEQRTIQATSQGYMGLSGRFACIAHFLGSKIVSETAEFFSSTPLEDVWAIPEEAPAGLLYDPTRIHEANEDGWSREVGYIFDGLSRGMHLEIKYLSDERSLTVSHRGVVVFREVRGELECFAPDPEWEGMVARLYAVARPLADAHRRESALRLKEETSRELGTFLDKLRLRWGV